jgi:fibronectin-binding autotransporter adhesin
MTITNSSLRLVALVSGVAVALALMGAVAVAPAQAAGLTQTQIQSIVSLLASFGADQATINNVTAALNGQASPGTGTGSGGACPALSRDLQVGSTGADVKALQMFLNTMTGTMVASSGAGSPGNETTTFGPATKAAVIKFQTLYNITPIAGYAGAKTRAQIAAVCGGNSGTPGTIPTTGGAISVGASAQPVNSLAPLGASRVPFTTFTVTNNSGQAVTVNSVTVQRVGLGVDNNFSGIVLLDQNGIQTGTAKTLNSNHQANLDGFTLAAGASQTFTVAGNISSSATSNSGQIVGLQVVAINTGATVSGSLPITGASQTINTTLTLGSVSTTSSAVAPSSAQNKNLGDTGVRVSGLRFTAGSAEDLKLYSIRWRQVGTASASDIANVVTLVDDVSYPTTISADGKYYTTIFPGGLLIAKGNTVDVSNKVDLVGTNSVSRTVDLDIDRATDVYFVGQTYGYGVSLPAGASPWHNSAITTITGGSATTIGKATEVAAQNIAVNVPNQILGGFVTDFKGEAVTVTSLPITIATTSGFTGNGPITSISLVNQNGVVVAGPLDEATTCTSGCTVTFTDSITFPVGRQVWTIKGKIPSGVSSDSTVIVTTVPTSWSGITGATSGNTISLTQGSFAMNTMTVKAASLTASMSTQPAAQNIVAGAQNLLMAQIQLDASASGEDIRMSSIPVTQVGTITELSSCQIFNGNTALNTGTNVPSALSATTEATTFTFDQQLVIPKGTVVTLGIKCNVSSNAVGTHFWRIEAGSTDPMTGTGVTSGAAVNITETVTSGGLMTIASGSATVAVDSSSPSFTPVAAGTTGQVLGMVKLRATNEAITLNKLGLVLTNSGNTLSTANGGSTNSGVSDLVQVYVYDGSTLVGTATFTGTSPNATSTLTTPVTLPKNTDKILTLKADLAQIGDGSGGGVGDVIKLDPSAIEGVGQSSGATLTAAATAGVAGVQMFKSYPTVAAGTGACSGTSCNGTDVSLKRFTITANSAGPVGLNQIAVNVATSSAQVTNLKLFAYTDSGYSTPANVSGTTGGQFGGTAALNATLDVGSPTVSFHQSTPLQIPTGSTYYFAVKGTVTPTASATNWSVNVTVLGDSATSSSPAGYNATSTPNRTSLISGVATTTTGSDFIWSDNASTTAGINDIDWFNGYAIPGLSSSGF